MLDKDGVEFSTQSTFHSHKVYFPSTVVHVLRVECWLKSRMENIQRHRNSGLLDFRYVHIIIRDAFHKPEYEPKERGYRIVFHVEFV